MSVIGTASRAATVALIVGLLGTRSVAGEPVEATSYYDGEYNVESLTQTASETEGAGSSAASCGSSASCQDFCGNCCEEDCCPCWTVRAGVVVLTRGRPHSSVLIENTANSATILNANQFNFNWNVGADISARKVLGSGRQLEVRYFGVDGNSATVSGTTSSLWDFPTSPPLFGIGAADFTSTYLSKLFSTEINLRQASDRIGGLTWLLGFRWIQVSDQFNTTADFGNNVAQIDFSTLNNLYGAQMGADMLLWGGSGPFRLDGIVKVGAYYNSAHNGFNLVQNVGSSFAASDNEGQFAFAGELGLTGAYQLTDHVALRGGYQLLWLEGVATSGDQVQATDVTNGNGINTGGEIFYHGAMGSVDFTW